MATFRDRMESQRLGFSLGLLRGRKGSRDAKTRVTLPLCSFVGFRVFYGCHAHPRL